MLGILKQKEEEEEAAEEKRKGQPGMKFPTWLDDAGEQSPDSVA